MENIVLKQEKSCGECEYWDREYKGFLSDIFKPCKHPHRMRKIGNEIDTRHSDDHTCDVIIR